MSMSQQITFRLLQTLLLASVLLHVCEAKGKIQRDLGIRFLAEEEDHHDEEDHVDELGAAHEDHDDEDKPWLQVILATLLVNCAALVGLVILIPSIGRAHLFCLPWRTVRSSTEEIARAERKNLIRTHILDIGIPSFACGALMAAAVFIIIPESLTLITQAAHDEDEEDGHDEDHRYLEEEDPHDDHGDEPQGTWKFGVAVLAGFLLPTLLGALFPRAQEHECDDECPPNADSDVKGAMAFAGNSDDEPCSDLCHKEDSDCEICSLTDGNDDKPNDIELNKVQDSHHDHDHDHSHDHFHDHNSSSLTKAVVASAVLVTDRDSDNDQSKAATENTHIHHHHPKTRGPINYRLCASILLGDSFHNFADGIFIGAGFMLCGTDVAISIMVATLYHEIAQELADFFLLTRHANLQAHWALLLNFISGLSCTLGGILILAFSLTNEAIGVILGIAGGVYIHVAASECVPRIEMAVRDSKDRLLSLGWFCVGAVPIGLVLLNHQHCEAH